MRFAVINENGVVVNVIELDNENEWGWASEHQGFTVVQSDTANIGDTIS